MPSPTSWRRRAYELADRRGPRSVLGLARSVEIAARHRELCLVRPDRRGGWQLRARDGRLFGPEPNLLPPQELTRRVLDVFAHGYRPQDGEVVVDVGAGVGREAFVFSRLVGSRGVVHAVEAHPATFAVLERMRTENAMDNIVAHNVAVAETEGELTIGDDDSYYKSRLTSGTGHRVRATTLGSLLDAAGADHVDLLVMNIEGAELPALRAFADLADRVAHVAISCHDFLADETGDESLRTKAGVVDILERRGFTTTDRPDDSRRWLRSFVYGRRQT